MIKNQLARFDRACSTSSFGPFTERTLQDLVKVNVTTVHLPRLGVNEGKSFTTTAGHTTNDACLQCLLE